MFSGKLLEMKDMCRGKGVNPIPHGLWYDVITRAWAIMAHVNLKAVFIY